MDVDVYLFISKFILVLSKFNENRIYYIPFDAPRKALQHDIFTFYFGMGRLIQQDDLNIVIRTFATP
jgi:hypothetical protein